jgi:MoaA/NifB/PqqE/SkfB family radical SAM enzyme
MKSVRYDVEADWQLLNTCNYRCGYCFHSAEVLGEKLRQYASPEAWQNAFDKTGLIWLLHLTGGEPVIYPNFVELCTRLSQRHYLSMNSNLAHGSISGFVKAVDPARVTFINAGLHQQERRQRGGFAIFLKNAELLLDHGFPVFVSIVATPDVLAKTDDVIGSLSSVGLVPFPKLLRGMHEGRSYPRSYTLKERESFRLFAEHARQANRARMSDWHESPSIDPRFDDDFLGEVPRFTGQNCAAGQKFIRIEPNGNAFRCSIKTALGNILDQTLVLRDAQARCNTSYCFYFCRKYTDIAKPDRNAPRPEKWWRKLRPNRELVS